MKNDTLRLIPREKGDSLCKKEIYRIKFKCYKINKGKNSLYYDDLYYCDLKEYSIWKSQFNTYIVRLWSGAKCDEYCNAYKFMQYDNLKNAWQYKRTCFKNVKKQFDKIEILEEENWDNYKQELDR